MRYSLFVLVFSLFGWATAQQSAPVWNPNNADGTYQNPIIFADYSDPDLCRVGNDYYMTASSFTNQPGLPILHSTDLVNWTLIGHAVHYLEPTEVYDQPDHGNGIWAPAIRHHNGKFYIYYGDPNYGIFMLTADDPAGPWTRPHLVQGGKGWIDSCPFWDDDGQAYLVHAWAGSRAGIKSVLMMRKMTADGKSLFGDPVMIFDGHLDHTTVEGPKMYKKNGYYYVFAPAGGVSTGWQLVLRSRSPMGPYEEKVVMAQEQTAVNGPHQGGWVESPNGESWFIHFQDRYAYGRIVHLQPMSWEDDWPVIGVDSDGNGIGEPVQRYRKPFSLTPSETRVPATSDEFNLPHTGYQWQWHANPQVKWGYPSGYLGFFRLNAVPMPETATNLWPLGNLFMQKFPAESFTATTRLEFFPHFDGERTGLVIMGMDYAHLSVVQKEGNLFIQQALCHEAVNGTEEVIQESTSVAGQVFYLRVSVKPGAVCQFSYSQDGVDFLNIGTSFTAREGKWIGAKVGLFCTREGVTNNSGYVNVDWFRVE